MRLKLSNETVFTTLRKMVLGVLPLQQTNSTVPQSEGFRQKHHQDTSRKNLLPLSWLDKIEKTRNFKKSSSKKKLTMRVFLQSV